jgi:hypothetical protein
MLLRSRGNPFDGGLREDAASGTIMCIFHANERRPGRVVGDLLDRRLHLIGVVRAAAARDGELHAGEHRAGGDLVEHGVGAFAHDDFIAGDGLRRDGELIPHRSRGDEEGGFFAAPARDESFERDHRGVFPIDVVTDFGLGHGFSHGRGRLRHGVAAEVNHGSASLTRTIGFALRATATVGLADNKTRSPCAKSVAQSLHRGYWFNQSIT